MTALALCPAEISEHILGSFWHKQAIQPSQLRLSHFLLFKFSVRMFPTYAWPSRCLAFLPTPLHFSMPPHPSSCLRGERWPGHRSSIPAFNCSFLLVIFLSLLHTFLDRNLLHVFSTDDTEKWEMGNPELENCCPFSAVQRPHLLGGCACN